MADEAHLWRLSLQRITDACEHDSASGITQRPLSDPSKVWRCDGCGWLHVSVLMENGDHRQVAVEDALAAAFTSSERAISGLTQSELWGDAGAVPLLGDPEETK